MLAFLMYMFALFFIQASSQRLADDDVQPGCAFWDDVQRLFGSVQRSMFTLMSALMGADWTQFYDTVEQIGPAALFGLIFYIAFFNVAVLNIVTGMFVQAAMKLAQPDVEEQAMDKLQEHMDHLEELRSLASEIDTDHDGFLSQHELDHFIRNPGARARLAVLDVDAKDAELFVGLIAATSENAKISLDDFVNGCSRLRGPASSIDLHCQSFRITLLHQSQRQLLAKVAELCDAFEASSSPVLPRRMARSTGCEDPIEPQGIRCLEHATKHVARSL